MSKQPIITGTGTCLPEKILTNKDLEKMVDTSDEWIVTRTGIKERRIAEKGQAASDLASRAAAKAITGAGIKPEDIDLIIVATITPDMLFPSTACIVQNKIGAQCPAVDVAAACAGFPYALSMAESYIRNGIYDKILVIGTEVLSGLIDWEDRSTCVLFGDGAGAVIVSSEGDGGEIVSSYLGANGNYADLLKVPAGGSAIPPSHESVDKGLHFLRMEGQEIFKLAVKYMSESALKATEMVGKKSEDVDCLIPHQANLRIIRSVANRLKIPMERVYTNVEKYGNMSSASTAVALCEAIEKRKPKPGSVYVTVAFGSGLTYASNVIIW